MDPRRNTPKHIIIKLPNIKDKKRILKAARGKEGVTYKGVPIRVSADFSKETLQARRGWKEFPEVMKGKDLHPRLLYLVNMFLLSSHYLPYTGNTRKTWFLLSMRNGFK